MTRYGCHTLQRNDRDPDPTGANARWGGVSPPQVSVCAGAPVRLVVPVGAPGGPVAGTVLAFPTHVRRLQEDLLTLGFALIGTPDGTYGGGTERAVREFQIYAKMANVARVKATAAPALQVGANLAAAQGLNAAGVGTALLSPYVDSLEQVTNDQIYAGEVTGILNADTRRILTHWLTNNFRCPVIIEAWRTNATGARTTLVRSNLYDKDDEPSAAPRMFSRDFTDRYTFPAGKASTDMHALGDRRAFAASGTSGPTAVPESLHCWAEAEILPERFMAAADTYSALRTAATATPPTRVSEFTTFRVVRAVSEVECKGYMDCINGNDNAFISLGPCHWTLAIESGTISEGELPGYFSYLRQFEPAAYDTALGFFGLQAADAWNAGGTPNGSTLFSRGQMKFSGRLTLPGTAGPVALTDTDVAGHDYFRTWHWFYRFMMAGRTVPEYQSRMWDMARMRVRDIMRVPWGAPLPAPVNNDGTIGTVFTSEKALAMLLRWHIRFPGDVATRTGGNTTTSNRIRAALAHAQTNGTQNFNTDPSTWTNAHEQELITGLDAQVTARSNANLRTTVTSVMDWPGTPGSRTFLKFGLRTPAFTLDPLSSARNSLVLHTAGLPAFVAL